jgi:hypothetical protein
MKLSSCCGENQTEDFNEDNCFCRSCRDHCDYIEVCDECSEEACVCEPSGPSASPQIIGGKFIVDGVPEPYMQRHNPGVRELAKQTAGMVAMVVGLVTFLGLLSMAREVWGK